jgi:hypothetical protein
LVQRFAQTAAYVAVAETDVTDVTSYPTNIQDAKLTFALPFHPFLAPCLTAVRKIAVIELDELAFGVSNANHVADTKDLRCEDRPVLLPACVRRFFRSTQTRALEGLLGLLLWRFLGAASFARSGGFVRRPFLRHGF